MKVSRGKSAKSGLGWAALLLAGTTAAGYVPPPYGPVPWGSFFHAQGRHLLSDTSGEKVFFRGVNLSGLEFGSFFDHPTPVWKG